MTFGPCAECARHVRVGADRCPFCGAEAAEVAAGEVRPVGRRELTRAAIFAGAALLAGCGGSSEAADEVADDDGTTGGDDPGGGDALDEARDPECDIDPRRCRQLPPCVHDGTCPAPPYGAPPADVIV